MSRGGVEIARKGVGKTKKRWGSVVGTERSYWAE